MTEQSQDTALSHAGHDVISVGQGGEVEEVQYEDYWGTDATFDHYLPDGKQYLTIKKMSEGNRGQYQYEAGMRMTAKRKTGDTEIDIDQAKDRAALIANSVVAWHIVKKDATGTFIPMLFNKSVLQQWVRETNPNLVDGLVAAIRKFNPFLQEDLSVEDLEKQRDEVNEMLELARKREAEANFSTTK